MERKPLAGEDAFFIGLIVQSELDRKQAIGVKTLYEIDFDDDALRLYKLISE